MRDSAYAALKNKELCIHRHSRAGNVAQSVEFWSRVREVLCSIPITAQRVVPCNLSNQKMETEGSETQGHFSYILSLKPAENA